VVEMVWTEKHRPRSLNEIIGNEEAKLELVRWLRNWEEGKSDFPGILLVGPPGIGKTTAVHALANDFSYHVVELNASEYRTAEKIYEKLGSLGRSYTLERYFTGRERRIIVFFDEIDGIDPKEDRGGLDAVIEIAGKRDFPVVAAANVPDPQKHKKLFELFKVVEFRQLTPKHIIILLKRIVEREGLKIDYEIIKKIAERARGDARLAINMLQAASLGIPVESISQSLENLPLDELLRRLSSSLSYYEIKQLIDANSSLWEDLIYTYFDIIARSPVLKFDAKIQLLDALSKIDIYLGRMNKERQFFYLRYLSHLIAWLIYNANKSGAVYDGRIPEYRLYKFVFNRDAREEFTELSEALGRSIHESRRKFTLYTLPTFCKLVKRKYSKLCEWVKKVYGW